MVFTTEAQALLLLGRDIDAHFEAMAIASEQLASHTRLAYAMVVVPEDAPPPSAEMRAHAGTALGAFSEYLRALAIVIEGSGVVATTKRTMARVMFSLTRSRIPFRVFSDTDSARDWLREEAGSHGEDCFSEQELPAREGAA